MSTYQRLSAVFDLRHLGKWSFCVRTSFKFALFSMTCLLIALVTNSHFVIITALCSVPLTLLWISHIAASAIRNNDLTDNSRRTFARTLLKAIISAAILSASSRLAYADSSCGGWNDGGCVTTCERQDTNGKCHFCHSCCADFEGQC
jgi:hypothetical protein